MQEGKLHVNSIQPLIEVLHVSFFWICLIRISLIRLSRKGHNRGHQIDAIVIILRDDMETCITKSQNSPYLDLAFPA